MASRESGPGRFTAAVDVEARVLRGAEKMENNSLSDRRGGVVTIFSIASCDQHNAQSTSEMSAKRRWMIG